MKNGFKFNSQNLFVQTIIFLFLVALGNVLFYFILNNLLINTQAYIYIWPINLLVSASFDLLNQVSTITISGLIALMTIFFMIIALSFNLNTKLPDKIIYKYIIYNKLVISYLSILSGFLLFQLFIVLTNLYDPSWAYVFLLNLIIALIFTLIFFYWFIGITNKKGIFRVLNKNIEHQHFAPTSNNSFSTNSGNISINSSGDYYILKSNLFDNKKIPLELPQSITKTTTPLFLNYNNKEGIQHISFASLAGITKIDYKKIESLIKLNLETINYIMLPKEGTFVSQMGLLYKFCFYTKDETKQKDLIKELSKAIKIIEPKEIEEINDWMLFLDHSRKHNPKEIEDDFNFLKAILKKAVSRNQFNLIKLIFDTLERNFDENQKNNDKILEQTISLIYSLKHDFSNNFQMLQFIQSRFKNIMINYSLTLNNKYSSKYATAVLYLSEFIRFDFMKKFEEEVDLNKLDEYNQIINDNIELSNQILYNTINLYFKETKYYSIYLREHMQQFISGLQFYYEDPYHYNQNYYQLGEKDKEIIDKKCRIIKEVKLKRTNRITESAFYLLYLVDNKKIPKKLISLIFDFLNYGEIYADIDPAPSWIMREELHPEGAFMVQSFPKNKYIILYFIYLKQKNSPLPTIRWEYNKLHLAEELKKSIENLDHSTITGWIGISEDRFKVFKKELIDLFSEGIKKCNDDEITKILGSNIDESLVKKFKEEVKKRWEERAIMRKLFKDNKCYIKKLDKKPRINSEKSFGFYFTFEKSYFIKNPPVGWARTLESDYGISLARNEDENIIKEIISTKKIQFLKKDLENSLIDSLNKLENKKDLIIILDMQGESKIDKLQSFTHKYKIRRSLTEEESHPGFVGYFKYKTYDIPVYSIGNSDSMLIIDIKNVAKLVQYSAYGDSKDELYVNVEELDEADIKQLKNIKYPKTKVKVRILEKFRIEDINKRAFCVYKLSDTKETIKNE